MTWLRPGSDDGERGSALVEFVFIALVVFVPLIYIVAGFSAVQRGVFASTAAAREAGRAIAHRAGPGRPVRSARCGRRSWRWRTSRSTRPTSGSPTRRPAPTATTAGGYTPTLAPGEEFSVCVTVTVRIPMLPEFIDANTATGQFVVERDRYVDG